jgi:hypothetical protein
VQILYHLMVQGMSVLEAEVVAAFFGDLRDSLRALLAAYKALWAHVMANNHDAHAGRPGPRVFLSGAGEVLRRRRGVAWRGVAGRPALVIVLAKLLKHLGALVVDTQKAFPILFRHFLGDMLQLCYDELDGVFA